jgi:hypothetical protein
MNIMGDYLVREMELGQLMGGGMEEKRMGIG